MLDADRTWHAVSDRRGLWKFHVVPMFKSPASRLHPLIVVRADGDDRWRLVSPAEESLGLWTLGQHRPGSAQDHGVTSSERLVITRW